MPATEELLAAKEARIDEIHRPVPARTALLVGDMQRAFMERGRVRRIPAPERRLDRLALFYYPYRH